MAPLNDLSNLDVDEVSPVKRGAIGKIWAFLKSNDDGDLELSKATVAAMGTPLEGEEALVAGFEKDGLDEAAVEAGVLAHRLKSLFEKAKKPATPTDADMNDNDTSSGDNEAEPDADDMKKEGTNPYVDTNGPDKKKRAKRISGDPDPEDDLKRVAKDATTPLDKSADDVGGNANKERVVAEGHTGLVQKEDGSWDTSGVDDPAARSFYNTVLKSLDDSKAEAENLRESVTKAEADNAELKDKLVVKEITAQAEGEFSAIAKADELVPVLKAAKDSLPAEQYEKLAEILKSANARIEAGDLFAEIGRSADPYIKQAVSKGMDSAVHANGGGDAWDQIVTAADAMVLKDGDELSEEQRVAVFLKTNDGKRLYADYMAENPGAVA